MLTRGLRWPELQRKMAGGEILRRRRVGVRGDGCCRGSPGSWSPWIDAWRSCEGARGIREVRGSPVARNHENGASHQRRLRFQFWHGQVSVVDAEASDSFLIARWSYCGPWPEMRGIGAVDLRRSRSRGVAGQPAAVRGSTAPRGLGLGFTWVRVPLFVGRWNDLGVRAGRGARRDSRAVGVRRGRREKREDGGAGRWGRPVRGRERGGGALGPGDRGKARPAWPTRGERGRGKRGDGLPGRERGWPKCRRGRRAGRAAVGLAYPLSFLFFFSFLSILKLFKHNYLNSNKFEFKPYNSTQGKQCSSMNAQTC
jgi:hypothetical protein